MLKDIILFGSVMGLAGWATYEAAIKPPLPEICGSKNGPPITSSRIQLKDGRHLAYEEYGVPKDIAKHKIVFIHGFYACRHDAGSITSNLSSEMVESEGIYVVSFDRPGYGESDPHPNRTTKSFAFDVEEFADQLGLGDKFYVVGHCMGGQLAWACLKYIPHRLAGVALLAPVVNYWWPGFPANVSRRAYAQQSAADKWVVGVAHYMPWLTYSWNTETLIPSSNIIAPINSLLLSIPDIQALAKDGKVRMMSYHKIITQQGEYESIHRDLNIAFGTPEFDPMNLDNPFPVSVHLWHGDHTDCFVPVSLQRYIAHKLPWIQYHEISDAGHFFPDSDGMADKIIQQLITA